MWDAYKKGYKAWLRLEKSLSDNSVEAYLRDVEKLTGYLQLHNQLAAPGELELKNLQQFVKWIGELGMTATSQARIISGIRSFYTYCLLEQIAKTDPSTLLDAPKTRRKLPDVFDRIPANGYQSFFIAFTNHTDKTHIKIEAGYFQVDHFTYP